MITEDYVSFEVAKLLKDKGFPQKCPHYYLDDQRFRHCCYETIPKDKEIYDAPTQAVAMKWLREVYNLGVFPSTYHIMRGSKEEHVYGSAIVNLTTFDLICDDIMPKDSYEEACEVAIKYCLENLIK